jgi:cytochrome P450
VLITIRDSDNTLIWSKFLRKGHYIINWISGVGKNSDLYPNPEAFNPLRFETIPTQLPWLPFTTGHHTCPGQFLARAEMESFVYEMLRRFNIQTVPSTGPIESKGTFTLHADPDAKIKIRFDSL